MMQLRGHRSAFVGLAILLGLLAALVVGEIGLRLLGYPRTYPAVGLFEPDPSLGYRLVAGFLGTYWKGGQRFEVRTNADGFRDARDFSSTDSSPATSPDSSLDEGVRRILAVGDSFAFGMPVEADEAFLSVFERELDRVGGGSSSWQVFNLGVPSYSTRQESILLERWAPRLDPVLALVVFCLDNDLSDNVHPPHAPANRAHGGIQVTRAAAAAVERPMGEFFFAMRVQLARFVLYDALSVGVRSIWQRWWDVEMPSGHVDPIEWEATREAFEEILSFSRGMDLELRVVLIPEKDRVLDASLPDEKRIRITSYLRQRGIAVLDPTDRLRSDPEPARLFERHGSHFTVVGNELVGRFLAGAFSERAKSSPEVTQ